MAIASKVIKTISENESNGKTWGMWVIQYYDPDEKKTLGIKVVTGEKKLKQDGDIWYVAKGMSVRDFNTLRPMYKEFVALAENPPAIEVESENEGKDEEEEVPF